MQNNNQNEAAEKIDITTTRHYNSDFLDKQKDILTSQDQFILIDKCPRRPLSPYLFFSQIQRKQVRRENPGWNPTKVMKLVSSLWQKLSKEEKLKYEDQSMKDRERYESE